jgi:hypothetical protein
MTTVAKALAPVNGTAIDPVTVFRARCEARAYLYAQGEFDLHSAVDLQAGTLVDAIGQDAVQGIIARAFRPVRECEWRSANRAENADDPSLMGEPARPRTPATTVEALMFGLRRGLSCLADPGNCDRLQRCDPDAIKQIAARLRSWRSRNIVWLPAYSDDDIAKLIRVWRAIRGAQA